MIGGGGGAGEMERDGGKMRGVNRVGLSEKEGWRGRRETGGAQFAITGATGQKVSKKGDECVCVRVCVHEEQKKMVTECLCICVCVCVRARRPLN